MMWSKNELKFLQEIRPTLAHPIGAKTKYKQH